MTLGKTKTVRGEHIPPLFGSACKKKKKNEGSISDGIAQVRGTIKGHMLGPLWKLMSGL